MHKKLIAILLILVLSTSLFAGCGSGNTPSAETPAPEKNEPAAAPAADSPAEATRDAVELVWYVGGSGPQADTDAVLAEVNNYLEDKLNVKLKIVETDFGNYDQKMQMVIASQETYDLCYTAHWINNFYNNVNKNAFLELDDLIGQYAPELKASMPAGGWDAARVKGQIMAVPNQQIWAMTNGVVIEQEYLDKYNFDINAVKSLPDLEPLAEAIKADDPTMFPIENTQQGGMDFLTFYMGYDELAGRHIPGVVLLDDAGLTVVNQFELPQVQEHYKLMYDWSKRGLFPQDAATIADPTGGLMAGKFPIGFAGTMTPNININEAIRHGNRPVNSSAITESWLTTSGITATMTAVSRTSKNPERAVEFLNLFNTDKVLYNLVVNGIEGKHYEKLDGDFIRPIENSGYAPNADWMYGNQFIAYFKEGQSASDWDNTLALNQSAKPSPALGFAFDSTPVQTEMASVSAVVQEFHRSLDTGSANPETALPEFLNKLEGAGSKTIIAELQSQIDAWKAAK